MKRRQLLQWGSAAGAWILGGTVVTFDPALATSSDAEGSVPLLDLQDLSKPLPDHWVTPTEAFYIQTFRQTPRLDRDQWRLHIDGLVENPQILNWDTIQAQPAQSLYWTLECIGNPAGGELIGNALWTGTRLQPLLVNAQISPRVEGFMLYGADDYVTSVPRDDLLDPDVWLVYDMNGSPLTPEHGYPLRILIPGKYGQKQPKWITRIEAVVQRQKGHWEKLGWSDEATILTQALPRQIQGPEHIQRVSLKASRPELAPGIIVLAGVALASRKPIQQIEVSADGGQSWHIAEQNQPASPYEWTLWRYAWELNEPGAYQLLARAQTSPDDIQPLQDSSWSWGGRQAALDIKLTIKR